MTTIIKTAWPKAMNWQQAHGIIRAALQPLNPNDDYEIKLREITREPVMYRYIDITSSVTDSQLMMIQLRLTGYLA